jgi:GABA(A) receptor-associated protein
MKEQKQIPFKKAFDFETRKQKSKEINLAYPNYIPIIIESDPKLNMQKLSKTKYLFSNDQSIDIIIPYLTKDLELPSEQAIFFTIDGKFSIPSNVMLKDIYEKYKDEDGFLYIVCSPESVWG